MSYMKTLRKPKAALGRIYRPLKSKAIAQTRIWASKEAWRAALFYWLQGTFRREHQAILAGIVAHLDSDDGSREAQRFRLRRYTHKIEKGLCMRNRRDVFGLGFINETIKLFEELIDEEADATTVALCEWSKDVLNNYFEVTSDHPTIQQARERFTAIIEKAKLQPQNSCPYKRIEAPAVEISYSDLLVLAKRRRSVRWYLPDPVPREAIDKAITLAKFAPSACNRQPFEFRVFDEPERLKELTKIPMGISDDAAKQCPCMIVFVGNLNAFTLERDRHLIYIDASQAAMAFQFALEVQGLSSCCINWPDIPELEERMSEALGLKDYERPVMCMTVGYPDPEGMVAFSQKKPLEEIRSYN
jgi:nitroreductase